MPKSKMANFSRYLFLFLIALVTLFPIFWMASISLKTRVDALAMPPHWIFKPTLVNFKAVWDSRFLEYVRNSVLIGLASTILGLIFGVPAAYSLSRHRFKWNHHLLFWILSTRMAPPVALLIPFYIIGGVPNSVEFQMGSIAPNSPRYHQLCRVHFWPFNLIVKHCN